MTKKLLFKSLFFGILFLFLSCRFAFADAKRMRCNLSSDCRPGFVCVGGIGDYDGSTIANGCCEIILPIRQVCLMHNFLTGTFGRGLTALVIISMGLAGIFGKLSYKSLITFFVGVVCIFGSYQVVYMLTGYKYQMCELVDTSTPPGKCADEYDEETLQNAVG